MSDPITGYIELRVRCVKCHKVTRKPVVGPSGFYCAHCLPKFERPVVVNIKDVSGAFWNDQNFVYIGRPIKSMSHNGYLGNPFPIGRGMTRETVIAKFECYARDRMRTDTIYRDRVKALNGKTLVCYCKPKPCHGDILAQLCQELNEESNQ